MVITNKKTFSHPVKMDLTDKELLAYADELTDLDTKSEEVSLRHESEKNRFKSEVKDIGKNQSRIMNLLKTKEEFKDVECFEEFNWFDGIVEIVRLDTGEVVKTRKITAEEYQQNLPLKKEAHDDENSDD